MKQFVLDFLVYNSEESLNPDFLASHHRHREAAESGWVSQKLWWYRKD